MKRPVSCRHEWQLGTTRLNGPTNGLVRALPNPQVDSCGLGFWGIYMPSGSPCSRSAERGQFISYKTFNFREDSRRSIKQVGIITL